MSQYSGDLRKGRGLKSAECVCVRIVWGCCRATLSHAGGVKGGGFGRGGEGVTCQTAGMLMPWL